MIRILMAEDQGMVRGALATLLGLEPDFEVVAQVARGDEVLDAARAVRPDIALLDIEMPGATGLELGEVGSGRKLAVKLPQDVEFFEKMMVHASAAGITCKP